MKKSIILLITILLMMLTLTSCMIVNVSTDTSSNTDTDKGNTDTDTNDDTQTGGAACSHPKRVIDPAVDATCQSEGLSRGMHCEACGEVLVAQRVLPKIGHRATENEDVAPTCTEVGYTGGTHCDMCDLVMEEPTEVKPTGHSEVANVNVTPTCEKKGSEGGTHCYTCGIDLEPATEIPALGHSPAVVKGYPATCQKEGLSNGTSCQTCGKVFVAQNPLPTLDHREVSTADIAPTCTEVGYTGGTECGDCGKIIKEPTEVEPTGHNEVQRTQDVAPTCEEKGYKGGTYCSKCNIPIKIAEEIPALGHTEVAGADVAPTCISEGYKGVVKCQTCQKVLKAGTVLAPTGHTEKVVSGYAPTCSKEGLSDGKICSVCNTTLVEQRVLETTAHAEVITQAIAPTCKSEGATESRKCSVCGKVTLASTTIPKIGHTAVTDKAVEATCSQTGLTEGSHCAVCNAVIVPQQVIAKNGNHVYPEFVTVTKNPTTSSTGSATRTCTKCNSTQTVTLDKLVSAKVTKDDVYSVETDIYNAAYNNRWKMVDGNIKITADLWSSGSDWFGDKGDILTITLKQEMVLTSVKLHAAGNYTYGTVRVKDSAGNVTASKTVRANGSAYGGDPQTFAIYSGSGIKAYTIEVEIGDIKGIGTFRISEVEMVGTKQDVRISHTHNYREFIETTRVATCQVANIDVYECFCGKQKEITGAKIDHTYDTLKTELLATCFTDGKSVYACQCGQTKTVTTPATGHKCYKLVSYEIVPTTSQGGRATYQCIYCNQRDVRDVAPLPLEEINYLRVDKIENGKVTLKFNVYGEMPSYEVRYSTSEITEDNFSSATLANATITGSSLVTVTLNLNAGLNNCYYVALRPYSGTNSGEIVTVRVGGDKDIPIEYDKAQVYSGEVLNSFKTLFDEDTATRLGQIFNDSEDTDLYGSSLRPIVDLEYMHYLTKISFYSDAGYSITVRWSDIPLDFMSANSSWDGYKTVTTTAGWNNVTVNTKARYFQIIFKDGECPYEISAYGYQCGDGDTISTTIGTLPTVGELMGMCGFVAAGGGHTPIDSVSCTTVLREYHNFGWSYNAKKYGLQASFFTGSWMGDFDYEYATYKAAGINVIPCIQWNLGNKETISYQVDANKRPVYDSDGKLIRATFWERFDPHTYFVFADSVFAYAARYGTNSSAALLEITKLHCSDAPLVGQGTVEWIEMGNEPDGAWNGIHNYLSAYQLAAATSAAYDGHCSTLVNTTTGGYHLGGKNADPNMNFALAGVSGVSNEYITAMCYWMKANRPDGSVAFDAFNVHHYMSKQVELPNGSTAYVGISPEEAKLDELLSNLVELRDKYYPEKEVWLTEFGWDTNQSYATSTSAHAYGEYTGRQVQAMWLTRAYLLLSASGIDKADMYMCEDVGVEEESVGKYGTCGVIGFERDENGDLYEVKKDSYYYLYTLKNALNGYTFQEKVEAYDENVMIYKYETENGKTAYAVWCKTSDGTKSENYQLRIDGNTATLIEAVYGDIDGVSSSLTADELGYVSVDVSENPVYVIVD